jgi:hypothetical protein
LAEQRNTQELHDQDVERTVMRLGALAQYLDELYNRDLDFTLDGADLAILSNVAGTCISYLSAALTTEPTADEPAPPAS